LYNEDKIQSYANADVFILPSKDENFANTVLESLSQGTAVIVSKNVGLSDFVSKNDLGWVYDGSINNLVDVMNDSKSSPQKLKIIRETSTLIIQNNFSEENISNMYISMYNTSLNSH
jgi:glycosyltransferase involved in cell wall biosynthesis